MGAELAAVGYSVVCFDHPQHLYHKRTEKGAGER